ncbi:hypothetical protein UXU46_00205 (plasmid) [Campylobacter jejuni]
MKYYVTIYIDPLVECFLDFKNQCYWQREDFTHAFLGLTKGKSPDELDKADETLRQEYLKNKEWDKIDQKWYEAKEPNEFNDGFGVFWGIIFLFSSLYAYFSDIEFFGDMLKIAFLYILIHCYLTYHI